MFPRILLVLGVAAGLLSGCQRDTPDTVAPAPSPTPIEQLNTAQMALPRINFCSLVGDAAVAAVLDAERWEARSWDNGEHAPVTTDGEDVVAEHLCEWATDDGATARAWVFSPPVDRRFARQVARAERRAEGCEAPPAPDFGKPSVLQVCADGDQHRVRRAGLFQDTWFGCELTASAEPADVRRRADAWCSLLVSQFNTTR